MYDDKYITNDAALVSLDDSVDGIEADGDDVTIDWDEMATVTVDDPPYAEAFDTTQFYRIPATVARPIRQQYHMDHLDEPVTLMKPRDELKKAAWSLDNKPVTLGHPSEGTVDGVDVIHGFWTDQRYIEGRDDLDAAAYVPTSDTDAQNHIEANSDVSVGFHHGIDKPSEYSGDVTSLDSTDGVDGFQTDIYFDHTAFVQKGRCSGENGCGYDPSASTADSSDGAHGNVFKYGDNTTKDSERDSLVTDAPSGIYTVDGQWFAVGPEDHSKDSTDHPDDAMYNVSTCSDVDDAWRLRNHGEDLQIEQSTLEDRIQRAASAHNCNMDFSSDCADCDDCEDTVTTNKSTNNSLMDNISIDIDDLTAEAALQKLGESHDGIAELAEDVAEYREVNDTAESLADELGVSVDEIDEKVSELKEKADAYDEQREEKMQSKASELAEVTERFDSAEEVLDHYDEDYDSIVDSLELVKESADVSADSSDEPETSPTSTDSTPSEDKETYEEQIASDRSIPSAWQ